MVGQVVLHLGAQIVNDASEYLGSGLETYVCIPIVTLNELNHNFSYLEEVVLRIARN